MESYEEAMTISTGKFSANLNDIWTLAEKLGLSSERIYSPKYIGLAAGVRALSYVEQWEFLYRERLYDIKLFDSSLLQFRRDPTSYSYVECPYDIPSFDAFAESKKGEDTVALRAEYELLMSTLDPKTFTPIRFDYDPDAYLEGLHPAAHVHIGHRSNIRVATERILNPMSFFLMVLRQVYPDHWKGIQGSTHLASRRNEIRTNLTKVEAKYRRPGDFDELYLV